MKLFLKSTALFACVAILFSACSTDDTSVDSEQTKAPSTEITSIKAGNGRFEIEWVIPEGTADDIYCNVAWTGPTSGSCTLLAADADGESTLTYTSSAMATGEYTVTLENFGATDDSLPVEGATIYVYGIDTYENEIPTIKNMFIAEASVTMEWNEANEDCSGVMISYTNSSGSPATSSLMSVDSPFTLTNVKSGSDFTYTVVFQPEEGIDDVIVSGSAVAAGTFPTYRWASVPDVPTEVYAHPGNFKLEVGWVLTDSPARVLVTYADGDDVTYQFIDDAGSDDFRLFENIPIAENGTYEVSVRAISSDGNASEAVICSDVEVYDYVNYKLNCAAPTIDTYIYRYNSYQLKLYWEENDNCEEAYITYVNKSDYLAGNNSATTTVKLTLGELMTFDDIVPGSGYTCVAKYNPAVNSLDVLTRETAGTFPDAEVWKREQDSGVDFADYTYVWRSYPMDGDAVHLTDTGDDDNNWSVLKIFDTDYDSEIQYKTLSNATAPMQTVTIDLGRTYKLSKFAYKAYGTSNTVRISGSNLKILNLYGTSAKDPSALSDYNGYTSTIYTHGNSTSLVYSIPDLENWTCLYYNATMTSDLTANSNGAFEFEISDEHDPVRYIRIQFVESFMTDRTNEFYVGEVDFWHRGVFDWDNGHDGEYRNYAEWANH